jgi:hypothetical protein
MVQIISLEYVVLAPYSIICYLAILLQFVVANPGHYSRQLIPSFTVRFWYNVQNFTATQLTYVLYSFDLSVPEIASDHTTFGCLFLFKLLQV